MPNMMEIDALTAKAWQDAGEAIFIDVREDAELAEVKIRGIVHNPMSQFDPNNLPVEAKKKLVFVCAQGMRSKQVGQYLLNVGILEEAYNLTGGTKAWAEAGLPFEHEHG